MKLTNRDAQRLLIALRNLEAGGETKLTAQTRMNIAININRLMPVVAAFETGTARRRLDQKDGDNEANRAIERELLTLADALADFEDLLPIGVGDLDLANNAKISGEHLAALAPALAGLEAKAA